MVSKYPASPTKYMYVQPARHPHKHTQKHNTASTCFWFSSSLRRERGKENLQFGDLGDEVEGLAVRLEGNVVPGGDLLAILLLV